MGTSVAEGEAETSEEAEAVRNAEAVASCVADFVGRSVDERDSTFVADVEAEESMVEDFVAS